MKDHFRFALEYLASFLLAVTVPAIAFAAEESSTSLVDAAIEARLNGELDNKLKEFAASTISKRLDFLDLAYVSPNDESADSGWLTKYDWNFSRNNSDGFTIRDKHATVRNFKLNLSLSGSYSYGDLDNTEDYSKGSFEFGIERGNFGEVQYQPYDQVGLPYQECLRDEVTADIATDTELYQAQNEVCQINYGIEEIINNLDASSMWSLTGHIAIEGDQNYDTKNETYGASLLYSHSNFLSLGLVSLKLTIDQVDPSSNEQRKLLVGDDTFDRASAEVAYRKDLSDFLGISSWFYVSHRYFEEFSAPAAVRDMSMDKFDYTSASVRFSARALSDFIDTDEAMFYIRYTKGQLPFDPRDDSTFAIGFSSNIEALANLFTN